MPNLQKKIDEWEVRDLEDDSVYRVLVEECSELGNDRKPGLRITYTVGNTGYYAVYEPRQAERWVYLAGKEKKSLYPLPDKSWTHHEDRYVKNGLVIGETLKARVEIKVRSKSEPEVREYALPFTFDAKKK